MKNGGIDDNNLSDGSSHRQSLTDIDNEKMNDNHLNSAKQIDLQNIANHHQINQLDQIDYDREDLVIQIQIQLLQKGVISAIQICLDQVVHIVRVHHIYHIM